jgi:hypothetical protein
MMFEQVERPKRDKATRGGGWSTIDDALMEELVETTHNNKAIKIDLALFHSSPAKGKLHREGYRVRHRVLPDGRHVAAWLLDGEQE